VKQVTTIEDALTLSPMWREFIEISSGEEWKFSPRERAWLRAAREIMDTPGWFLEALREDE
jgi:hypothetical protein